MEVVTEKLLWWYIVLTDK